MRITTDNTEDRVEGYTPPYLYALAADGSVLCDNTTQIQGLPEATAVSVVPVPINKSVIADHIVAIQSADQVTKRTGIVCANTV